MVCFAAPVVAGEAPNLPSPGPSPAATAGASPSPIASGTRAPDPAPLPEETRRRIDLWLRERGLNEFGDPRGSSYVGGTPLFDESTGVAVDRYDYLIGKLPEVAKLAGREAPTPVATPPVLPQPTAPPTAAPSATAAATPAASTPPERASSPVPTPSRARGKARRRATAAPAPTATAGVPR